MRLGDVVACHIGNEPPAPLPPPDERPEDFRWDPVGPPIFRHGLVVGKVAHNYWLVLDQDGEPFSVYESAMYRPGERMSDLARSRVPFTDDPEDVRRSCERLLKLRGVQLTLVRIAKSVTSLDPVERQPYDPYHIPLKLCVSRERPAEISEALIKYIDASPIRRGRANATLDGMTAKQRRALYSCYFGNIPQSWLAEAWGISRQAVGEVYHRAVKRYEAATGLAREEV